jgi:VWFA-related protein
MALGILVFGCILASKRSYCQERPGSPSSEGREQTPTFKTIVRQVLVPIVVTDKKGHPVSGLRKSDFAIFEDEVPQQIIAFRRAYDYSLESVGNDSKGIRTRAMASIGKPKVGPDSPSRTYLVCVDTLHSNFGDVVQARSSLSKFFKLEQDDKAQYALMNLSRQVEVIQDSTRDPSAVLAALSSNRFQKAIVDSEASTIEADSTELRDMLNGFSPLACEAPAIRIRGTIPDNCSDMKRRVEMFIFKSAERTSLLTRTFLQELETVMTALAQMPTQRTMILISDGFDLVPGRELYGIASVYFPNDPEWRFNERDTQPELNQILRLAQRYNIVVYGIDSRGVYDAAQTGSESPQHDIDQNGMAMNGLIRSDQQVAWENGSAMAELAFATGGIYFHDNNDLSAGIRRAFNDERERYVIAYSPANDVMDGKYRKIRVQTRMKNLVVHAKSGYWAATGR